MNTSHTWALRLQHGIDRLVSLFNLRADTDEEGTVESVRANVDFRSANAWTLALAILIASIGLNTNSTAVIIGAMLISPLMGPIVGAGLGLGINDIHLVKRSLTNLAYAVGISIAASFLYFLLSPLEEAQSELLARTRPTVFDALIAIFGGAAGIVALSRKEKSNAIPGVAIATALMPPLCTAGYGLSQGNFSFFLGAMYLFLINSVYICLSTLFFIRYLGFRKVVTQDPEEKVRLRRWVTGTAVLVLIPSIISAWLLLRESAFRSRANAFVKKELQIEGSFVVGTEIAYSWKSPKVKVSLLGDPLSEKQLEQLHARLRENGLPKDALEIHQSSLAEKIEQRIKSGLDLEQKEAKESDLRAAALELQVNGFKRLTTLSGELSEELRALYPQLGRVLVVAGDAQGGDAAAAPPPMIFVQWSRVPPKRELAKVEGFLQSRTKDTKALISHFSQVRSPSSR